MTRGSWVAAVALGLGGWLPHVGAQEAIWRPVARPGDAAAAVPSAQMGKPVAVMRGSSASLESTPRPFPTAYQDAPPAGPAWDPPPARPGGAQAIATVAPSGTVIAASAPSNPARPVAPPPLPLPEDADQGQADQFAMDRPAPPGRVGPLVAVGPPQREVVPVGGDWIDKFPLPAPPPPPENTPLIPADAPQYWEPNLGAGTANRFFVRAEYLLWWIKNATAPPLLTTGDLTLGNSLSPLRIVGALGNPDTVQLFDGKLTRNPFSGARFTAGAFLDDCQDKAIDASGFFLGQKSRDFTVSSAQVPLLTRPFFAANQGVGFEAVQILAQPGSPGSATIHSPSQLWGLDSNLSCKVCCGCDYRVNALAGVRYLNLNESLSFTENFQTQPTDPAFAGAHVIIVDSFATRNQFYGGQVGVSGWKSYGRFDLNGVFKLALGSTEQSIDINGSQTLFRPNGQVSHTFEGGLLALGRGNPPVETPGNIGHFTRNRFSVVPELGATVGYNVTDNVRLSVGYNFLYWTNVVRPGDQIDRSLDLRRIPNFPLTGLPMPVLPPASPHPVVPFKETDFWAQGLTVGLEIKF